MAQAIQLPKDGRFISGALISKWFFSPGDRVNEGDILFSGESDKAVFFDFASPASGLMLARYREEGEEAVCGQALALLDGGEGGEDFAPREAPDMNTLPAEEAGYADKRLSFARKTVARSMHASLSEMAQLTLHSSFNAKALLECRKTVKQSGNPLISGITLGDMVLYAVAKTLPRHKELNAHFLGDSMRYFENVHLGVAVDTPRTLLVPTLLYANSLSLLQLSSRVKALAAQSREGTINPDLLFGGTFTVTNLGSLGIEMFTPVINPPQTGILGVNCISHRLNADGKPYPAMGLSLTFDHRALDGAPAARFLADLCTALEDFQGIAQ